MGVYLVRLFDLLLHFYLSNTKDLRRIPNKMNVYSRKIIQNRVKSNSLNNLTTWLLLHQQYTDKPFPPKKEVEDINWLYSTWFENVFKITWPILREFPFILPLIPTNIWNRLCMVHALRSIKIPLTAVIWLEIGNLFCPTNPFQGVAQFLESKTNIFTCWEAKHSGAFWTYVAIATLEITLGG